MMSGLTGQSDIAKAIFGAVTGAGYSPEVARTAVQAGLLESGLSPAARNSGHNSIFQTSADKGVPDDPAAQIKWLLGEMGRQGGPAAANADPSNFFANRIERGGYPGSNYDAFAGQAQSLLNGGGGGSPGVPTTVAASPGQGYPLPWVPGAGPLSPSFAPAEPTSPFGPDVSSPMPGQIGPFGVPGAVGSAGNAIGAGRSLVDAGRTAEQQPQQTDPYGVAPTTGPGGGSGIGITPGGTIDTALGMAAAAFPGLGTAAQTGMKLASRTIQYAGQVAGIAADGWLQTLLPAESQKAGSGWLQRGVGALASVKPALPNMAGGKAPSAQIGQAAQGQPGQPPPAGNTYNTTVNSAASTISGAAKDAEFHFAAQNSGPGH
jgi:hypothetical protein